jgi:Domain of unknown function (DUF1906)
MYIADESWAKTDPAKLVAAGYTGIIGYCSYDKSGKNLDSDHIKAYHAVGLHVGLVWETFGQAAQGGGGTGEGEARDFIAQARALGATGGTLWMVGEDPTKEPPPQWPGPEAYFGTAKPRMRTGGFTLGDYGSEALVNDLKSKGLVDRKWFVGGWSQDTNADLIQQSNNPGASTLGGAVDCNYAPAADWGWAEFGELTPPSPVTPPPPPPPPSTGLVVDGIFGPHTIAVLQSRIGVATDGIYGIYTRKALQSNLRVAADGIVGPITVKALQTRVGSAVDGVWGPDTTRHLQEALNTRRF